MFSHWSPPWLRLLSIAFPCFPLDFHYFSLFFIPFLCFSLLSHCFSLLFLTFLWFAIAFPCFSLLFIAFVCFSLLFSFNPSTRLAARCGHAGGPQLAPAHVFPLVPPPDCACFPLHFLAFLWISITFHCFSYLFFAFPCFPIVFPYFSLVCNCFSLLFLTYHRFSLLFIAFLL